SSVTSRCSPQHCGQIFPCTAGQNRFSLRSLQIAQGKDVSSGFDYFMERAKFYRRDAEVAEKDFFRFGDRGASRGGAAGGDARRTAARAGALRSPVAQCSPPGFSPFFM